MEFRMCFQSRLHAHKYSGFCPFSEEVNSAIKPFPRLMKYSTIIPHTAVHRFRLPQHKAVCTGTFPSIWPVPLQNCRHVAPVVYLHCSPFSEWCFFFENFAVLHRTTLDDVAREEMSILLLLTCAVKQTLRVPQNGAKPWFSNYSVYVST